MPSLELNLQNYLNLESVSDTAIYSSFYLVYIVDGRFSSCCSNSTGLQVEIFIFLPHVRKPSIITIN